MFWISSCLLLTVGCKVHYVAHLRRLVLWSPEAVNVISRAQSLPKHPANILRQNDIRSSVCLASGDGHAPAVFALTVVLVLIARDQEEGMVAKGTVNAPGWVPASSNLSAIFDRE